MSTAEQTTILTVAMAAVAAISSFGSAWLNYLQARDKLRYDAKLVALEEKTNACHEERDELKAQNARQQHQIDELWRRQGLPARPELGVRRRNRTVTPPNATCAGRPTTFA